MDAPAWRAIENAQAPCCAQKKAPDIIAGPCAGGAWASLPRDTLHVVLTKNGQAGLEISKEAHDHMEAAEAAAARFSHSAAGEPLVSADPQEAATAVVAQLAACMDDLQEGGGVLVNIRNKRSAL